MQMNNPMQPLSIECLSKKRERKKMKIKKIYLFKILSNPQILF